MSSNATPCWVWRPTDPNAEFRHPAEMTGDSAAKVDFRMRGPQIARLSPATMLQNKPNNMVMIAEKGAMLDVPKYQILPWYEGLLLLEDFQQSLNEPGHIRVPWWSEELEQLLDKEKKKFAAAGLNSSLYAEKKLLKVAVTGLKYIDGEGKEWNHRRENVQGEDATPIADGEDGEGLWKVKEITGYQPPWEAFHNDKCGFYQEFYQVKWDFPFSEVDYSSVENGCAEFNGATWEPDECLPAHLDPLRLKAKKDWIKARRERDAQRAKKKSTEIATGLKRKSGESPSEPGANSSPGALKKEQSSSPGALRKEQSIDVPPPAKMAKVSRDGKPLEQDLMFSRVGHDFRPDELETGAGKIRSGWPKRPEDYPKGFGVASPPGFCGATCDCMEDQRPQRSWEMRKDWLEESSRTKNAMAAIQTFSDQAKFVRRRGQVSKMFYFQTHEGSQHDTTFANAALAFASTLEKTMQTILASGIPVSALEEADEVRIPARVFLQKDSDYQPLLHVGSVPGGALPSWLRVCSDTGRLSLVNQPASSELPFEFAVSFHHTEGPTTETCSCLLVAETATGLSAPWVKASVPIAQKFVDLQSCTLERGVRNGLLEHFKKLYDFHAKSPHVLSLGAWVSLVSRIAQLLRCAGGANLFLGDPTMKR